MKSITGKQTRNANRIVSGLDTRQLLAFAEIILKLSVKNRGVRIQKNKYHQLEEGNVPSVVADSSVTLLSHWVT